MSTPVQTAATLLTPPGAGAIGIVRLQGPNAIPLIESCFRPKSPGPICATNRLRYGHILDGDEILDDVIISATNENDSCIVDIFAHGGPRIMQRLLLLYERLGAATRSPSDSAASIWPTESTLEREVYDSLARIKTKAAALFLARQVKLLPNEIRRIMKTSATNAPAAADAIDALLLRYPTSLAAINGVTIVLAGPPNSGKSTIFNRLAGREAAIVSPQAGTTRDFVSIEIELGGMPLTIIDTAGRRETSDFLEAQAIKSGESIAASGHSLIWVFDSTTPLPPVPTALADKIAEKQFLFLVNKCDLPSAWDQAQLEARYNVTAADIVVVSARTGEGFERLFARLTGHLLISDIESVPAPFTERQVAALTLASNDFRHSGSQDVLAACESLERLINVDPDGTEVA